MRQMEEFLAVAGGGSKQFGGPYNGIRHETKLPRRTLPISGQILQTKMGMNKCSRHVAV